MVGVCRVVGGVVWMMNEEEWLYLCEILCGDELVVLCYMIRDDEVDLDVFV